MQKIMIFPGQGSQKIGMAQDFYDNFSIARELFSRASDTLSIDFTQICFTDDARLNEPPYTQSAIFLANKISAQILKNETDFVPDAAFGHSLGELSAVHFADGFGFEDGLKITFLRGQLMQKISQNFVTDGGTGMLAVLGLDPEILQNFCDDARKTGVKIFCANFNGGGQIVLAGVKNHLKNAEIELKNLGAKRLVMLPVSSASHCPLLLPISEEFREILTQNVCDLNLPVISNATATPYRTKTDAINLLTAQLTEPVFYEKCVQNSGGEIFIECGGSVLSGLNRRITAAQTLSVFDVASLKNAAQILKGAQNA